MMQRGRGVAPQPLCMQGSSAYHLKEHVIDTCTIFVWYCYIFYANVVVHGCIICARVPGILVVTVLLFEVVFEKLLYKFPQMNKSRKDPKWYAGHMSERILTILTHARRLGNYTRFKQATASLCEEHSDKLVDIRDALERGSQATIRIKPERAIIHPYSHAECPGCVHICADVYGYIYEGVCVWGSVGVWVCG